ncbi:hypothetical protein D3C71_1926570 [compost metagenome]
MNQRRFGRRIGQAGRARLLPCDGSHVDDCAAAAPLHQRDSMLHADHRRANQQGERVVPSLGIHFLDSVHGTTVAGVVDQDVESAER